MLIQHIFFCSALMCQIILLKKTQVDLHDLFSNTAAVM